MDVKGQLKDWLKATGKDIAGLVIEFIEKSARDGKTKTKGRG